MEGRYSRQILFRGIGIAGQNKLKAARVAVIGCGGLGASIANCLVRSGLGFVRLVDRDYVELHNLHRQTLYTESDAAEHLPKAIAAARSLAGVNSGVILEPVVVDVDYYNIDSLTDGVDIIVDGLDNFETRYLINDIALKKGIPWVYGGAVGGMGMTMNFFPDKPPCLRCIQPCLPPGGTTPTCDTTGVFGPLPIVIGAIQAAAAIRLLVAPENASGKLLTIDLWTGDTNSIEIDPVPDCPACNGNYEFLTGRVGLRTRSLCGQNAVQVINPDMSGFSLAGVAAKLERGFSVERKESAICFSADNHEIMVFQDGRAIIKNTTDETLAKTLYTRYIGA